MVKRTLASAVRHEIDPIQGSRFVADAVPVPDAEAAVAAVARIRDELTDASHHCWAYRLGPEGAAYRTSDAGEPRGSAGMPILKRIEGLDLVDVLVVVTRWFGGTKLGVGGLVRAYGGAAAAVLREGDLVECVPLVRVEVTYPYTYEGRVKALLAAARLARPDAHYGADVRLTFDIPLGDVDAFVARLGDATSGTARVQTYSQ